MQAYNTVQSMSIPSRLFVTLRYIRGVQDGDVQAATAHQLASLDLVRTATRLQLSTARIRVTSCRLAGLWLRQAWNGSYGAHRDSRWVLPSKARTVWPRLEASLSHAWNRLPGVAWRGCLAILHKYYYSETCSAVKCSRHDCSQ